MKLPPQSNAIVQRLLAQQPVASGKLSIGALNRRGSLDAVVDVADAGKFVCRRSEKREVF